MAEKRIIIALAGNANVGKSIKGCEEVLIYHRGRWRVVPIGELIDSLLSSEKIIRIGEMECGISRDLFVASLDLDTFKVKREKVTHILRHKEHRSLIHLKTSSGRMVDATQDHNFIVLRSNGIRMIDASELRLGDRLPILEKVPSILDAEQIQDRRVPEKTIVGIPEGKRSQEEIYPHGLGMDGGILTVQGSLQGMEDRGPSGILWDEVVEIREVEVGGEYVYDLVVPGSKNFMLANGLFIHNSVLFNELTGLHQHIGNWPGKTVERAEGTLRFKGYVIDVVDLPGIYSLSTFSLEEIISRRYIAVEKPDLVVNVVDASVLERNLFFTIQLLELEVPLIIALNQVDLAKKKGITIDHQRLEEILGVPVIPTIAIKGIGIYDLLERIIEVIEGREKVKPMKAVYGKEVEERIEKLTELTEKVAGIYPARWIAVKLLEDDSEVKGLVRGMDPRVVLKAEDYAKEIEAIHGEPCPVVISCERYHIAHKVTLEVQQLSKPPGKTLEERLHDITTHKILGYPIMVMVMLLIYLSVFTLGDSLTGILEVLFEGMKLLYTGIFGVGMISELIWGGVIEGVIAGVTIALPYIIPFYIILGLLEDSGYLTRIAFLMDNIMHRMGLHGKAFIPLILGYGCNVPACLGCRIMETHRERLIAIFVTTLIPCAARTVIILGLVGVYVGFEWAIALYIIDLLIVFLLGRIAFKVLPGESMGLIMEMHSYRLPSLSVVAKQTWFRVKDFIYMAFPLIILGSLLIKLLEIIGLLEAIASLMNPITIGWLGLPSITGILLIFGILRKELTLIMLATLAGTANFAMILTPIQMFVFALVTMLYIPCIATIAVLVREIGWKKALYITLFEITFALFIGGIALRLLMLL